MQCLDSGRLPTSTNVHEMKKLIQVNDAHVQQIGFTKDCNINACDVKRAVSRLKAHKSDGSFELSTDQFLKCW